MNLFGFIFALVGVLIFYFGFGEFRKAQLIENIPTSKIRSIAMGLVEIKGKAVKLKDELIAPLTDTKCVYYEYEVDEWVKKGKSSEWQNVYRIAKTVPFYLEDDTGKVQINLTNVESHGIKTSTFLKNDRPDLYARFEREMQNVKTQVDKMGKSPVVNLFGISNPSRFQNSRLRFTEQIIPLNSDVYLLGTASSLGQEHIQNQDGIIVQQGQGTPFLVSSENEKNLKGSFKITAFAMLSFGAIFILAGVWIIIQ